MNDEQRRQRPNSLSAPNTQRSSSKEADELLQQAQASKPRTEAEFANRERDQQRARSMQAMSKREDTAERVLALSRHPDFSLRNPNRARSLVGAFCGANQVRFHGADGKGYRFLADTVIALDGNPQVAARMAGSLDSWRRFDSGRRSLMKAELERIAGQKPLSNDVFEIVTRALDERRATRRSA